MIEILKRVKIKNQFQKDFKIIVRSRKSKIKRGRIPSKDNKDIAKTKIHKNLNNTRRAVNPLANKNKVSNTKMKQKK